MFISQSAQTCTRPMMIATIRQQLCQKGAALIVPKGLLVIVGRVVLIICPVLFLVNLWLSAAVNKLALEVMSAEEGCYLLVDENIKLRAERARLYSPAYLNEIAANRLALYVPEKNQVTRF